jgi:murein DD-endopeptidase MepM/ murein hydrolase activator NlpD
MSIFTIEMSSPFPPGSFTGEFGGPDAGGHHGSHDWYIRFGMDLGADAGTEVHALFDGHVTVFHPHKPSTDTSKVFGAQIFIRSRISAAAPSFSDDKVGAFYTHVTDVPTSLRAGSMVKRGDLLGKLFRPSSTHLHLALVEIIGGAPGGVYQGVNIFSDIVGIANTAKVLSVTFQQNKSPPTVTSI